MCVSITKGLAVLTVVVLVLGAVGRTSGEIVIDQNTTINYTIGEDVHIVEGVNPPPWWTSLRRRRSTATHASSTPAS